MRGIIHHSRFTRRANRFGLAAALLIWLGLAVSYQPHGTLASFPQGADGRVSHTVNGNTEIWRIEEPNVQRPMTPYPQIRFQPGDSVTIVAGGCVQTGGTGSTWKLYVNPRGPGSDHLYHGLILIPGVAGALPGSVKLTRISAAAGIWRIPAGFDSRQLYLRLGYEDDDYGDNGYWGHDDGTGDQCKGVGNAFVNVIIVHGTKENPTSPQTPAPFDLSLNNIKMPGRLQVPAFDDNGILFNPMWGWQITHPGELPDPIGQCGGAPEGSRCTSQRTDEDNGDLCNLGSTLGISGSGGHQNWAAGTYTGQIYWNNHSCDDCDDDYNFRLVPTAEAGLNKQNGNAASGEKSMKLEFDSDETIDHFDTPWWNSLHRAVDDVDDAKARLVAAKSNPLLSRSIPALTNDFSQKDEALNGMLYGKDAIATGLIGLDCPHNCATELHPLWAIAIRVKDDPSDETWAIFVRRSGNEGFCSDHEHYLDDLPGDQFAFRLPWGAGASSVTVSPATIFKTMLGQASGPSVSWTRNQGVLVFFTVPLKERVNGELHLRWREPEVSTNRSLSPTIGSATIRSQAEIEDEPEDRFAKIVAGMTQAQRKVFDARIPRKTISHDRAPIRPAAPERQVASLPISFMHAQRPRVRDVPDPQKKARDQQRLDALRAVYGHTIPRVTTRGRRVIPPPK
jgi:hypothetical protein